MSHSDNLISIYSITRWGHILFAVKEFNINPLFGTSLMKIIILGKSTREKHQILTSSDEETLDVELEDQQTLQVWHSVSVWAIRSTRSASAKIFRTLSQKYRNFLGIWLRSEFVQIQNIISKRLLLKTIGYERIPETMPTNIRQIPRSFLPEASARC